MTLRKLTPVTPPFGGADGASAPARSAASTPGSTPRGSAPPANDPSTCVCARSTPPPENNCRASGGGLQGSHRGVFDPGGPGFEQGRSRPGCVRHAAPFRSTCGTSLREARLERETRNSRRRTVRQPRRGGHGRAGRAHAAAWMTSREPVFTPIAPSRIAGRRGPPPRRRPS